MVKVTVTLCTKRKDPRFEYALLSLKEQTFKDFEFLIVDGHYRERKNEVLELIKRMNVSFPVLYLPDKPSRWKGLRPQISNARNTALIFADSNSKYIVNVDDCTRMPRDWIEKHLRYLEQGFIVAGSWKGFEFKIEDQTEIEGCYGPESRTKLIKEPQIVGAGWFYGQNVSYSLEQVLDVNGFDEILDGEVGQEDINLAIRLERKGIRTMYDPTNMTEVYMRTHSCENMIIPVNLKLKDGKEHFSNEYITEKLLGDTGRVLPYGNPFNLRELRELVKGKNIEEAYSELDKYVDHDLYDWRDGKLISEKLK